MFDRIGRFRGIEVHGNNAQKFLRPSRRPVLLVVAAVLALAMFSATASSASTRALLRRIPAANPRATQPKPISTLVWDLPLGEPSSLNPTQAATLSPQGIIANFCDGLYYTDALTHQVIPDLATSFHQPNPLTLIYDIRQGVKFWDGTELTANDVVYSLDQEMSKTSLESAFFTAVKSITATNPYQVTIRLSHPDELLPRELQGAPMGTVWEAAFNQRHQATFGDPSTLIMCSGPFKLVKWIPGSEIEAVRNADYWNPAFRAKAATLIFKFISVTSAVTQGLASGSLDGSFEVPPSSINELRSTGQLRIGESPVSWYLQPDSAPDTAHLLLNPLIRKALSLVIDRSGIAKDVFNGAAQPLKSFIPPVTWGYAKSIFQSAYNALPGGSPDVVEARKLVKEAGSPKGTIVIAVAAGSALQEEMGTIIQQEASSIGLKIHLVSLSPTAEANLYTSPAGRKGIDGFLLMNYFNVYDPLDELPFWFYPPTTVGYINLINYTKVYPFLVRADETANAQARARLIVQAQTEFQTQDTAVIPLVNAYEVSYLRDGLSGAPTTFPYYSYPWAALIGATP